MKYAFAFLLSIMATSAMAQQVWVPYRVGKQFGLSDNQGKIIIRPQFDRVSWKQGSWFVTGSTRELSDTLDTPQGRYIRKGLTASYSGLIHNGSILLNNEPFDEYEIIADKCIAAKYAGRGMDMTSEQYKKYGDVESFYSLFNLKGENLFPKNFKRLQQIDTAGISEKDRRTTRYILFVALNFNRRYSMFVFDADKQKISDWLIRDAMKIDIDRQRVFDSKFLFSLTDDDGVARVQAIDYSSGKFILNGPAADGKRESATRVSTGTNYQVVEVTPGDYDNVVAPPYEPALTPQAIPIFHSYYMRVKDSLYYVTGPETRSKVNLAAGSRIIFTEPGGITQHQPLMVKSNNHFYIVDKGRTGTTAYDSLIYYGSYFLAWKQEKGQTRAGVITATDSAIIPMVYESICADIRFFRLQQRFPGAAASHHSVFREADSKYNYSDIYPYKRDFSALVTVFRGGKCGVISVNGATIVPIEYDMIGRNDMSYSRPIESDYLLLKKEGRYGIANLVYSRERKQQELVFTLKPTFSYLPIYYYPHYYNIKDYKLFGLYNEQMIFMGYGLENGKVFYQNE